MIKEKYYFMTICLLLLSANIFNIYMSGETIPNNIDTGYIENDRSNPITSTKNEFDVFSKVEYDTCSKVAWYIVEILSKRGIETSILFSKAIVISSDSILIVIGHGYLKGEQYYIGDFSSNMITKLSIGKKYIALLACYSSLINLKNEYMLVYDSITTLQASVNDLISFLGFNCNYEAIIPSIKLFSLDSGGSDEGGSDGENFFEFMIASTYYDGVFLRYDLNSENSANQYGNFIRAHPGVIFEINCGGDITIAEERTYFFGLLRREVETTEYHYIYCKQYGEFRKVIIEDNGYIIGFENHLFIVTYNFIADKGTVDEIRDVNNIKFEKDVDEEPDTDGMSNEEAIIAAALIGATATIASACIIGGITALVAGAKVASYVTILGLSASTVLTVVGIGLIVLGVVVLTYFFIELIQYLSDG
ncbi:MAG: hypothetical protein K9W46_02035 [Candidatus Heimdallarchaeum endolithica]|uniref:Uncharacterized protein n=1 Tax=Candidatus Heimdallarchaeum endolithica TaxID=2876572 RepID=A0A9Y1FP02_9ARCH|nr:MAG: hypothetical protein K9W46_02035 [Candidatus Heimdallarchaeum endolithica]